MNNRRFRDRFSIVLMIVALVSLLGSLIVSQGPPDADRTARRMASRVEKRLAILDRCAETVLSDESVRLPELDLPQDMVIYRYCDDTLQAWRHQFPLMNDDIRPGRMLVQRLTGARSSLLSPLADVGGQLSFVNYGPKWYLVRSRTQDNRVVVSGLEVVNELDDRAYRGINPRLFRGSGYLVQPLGGNGSPVAVGGVPLFKLAAETFGTQQKDSPMAWFSLALLACGALLFLANRRQWWRYGAVLALIVGSFVWAYFYGRGVQGRTRIFSPLLYADGGVLYSLGAVILLNMLITLVVLSTYLMRRRIFTALVVRHRRLSLVAGCVVLVTLIVTIACYLHTTFLSIVMNSGISLELYKPESLSFYSGVVYLSYLLLSLSLLLLVQMLSPALRAAGLIRYDVFSPLGRMLFALLTALYFVIASSVLGFRKEENRIAVWSNRLAMDRDISLEIQLTAIERSIASDPLIGTVSALENSAQTIENRLKDTYLSRVAQDYDITVYVMNGQNVNETLNAIFNERISSAVQIADRSLFYYSRDVVGRPRYSGIFTYYTSEYGITNVLVGVESKSNREDRGYLSLLGISEPGRMVLPAHYSHAKYLSGRLVTFKGGYAYPTVFTEALHRHAGGHTVLGGYVHFIHPVSDEETIVISRENTEALSYIVEGVLFALIAWSFVTAVSFRRRRTRKLERQYYRARLNAVMLGALVLTLVAMAVFSVFFVYRRNEADMKTILSSKISSIQSMLQQQARQAEDFRGLRTQEMSSAIDEIGTTLKSDVTLYTPSGLAFMTSTPEIFDRMIIGPRIDETALAGIADDHLRYVIRREKIASHSFWSLYAPIFNNDGKMIAIVSSPYTDRNYDLEREIFSHVVTIFTAFLLLLILARLVTSAVIGRMFKPLTEMSRKMNTAEIGSLEFIRYERDDEISTLVRAYNRMVQDLSDSTRRLAQAERDKAWSEMARQVAHEIKNPLTPIKLKLQMLIRMKDSGNPKWEEKFDEVASVVLEHIDILADTANEFSTFAKLYSEEPVPIDLDRLLREEVSMFDSRSDIRFTYIGFDGAEITGPKPQLTRVFVNLITNAVQAVEGRMEEQREAGETPLPGEVYVSLRNAAKDGFYDIVFEDNGPGVKEENRSRLFTPNFTTKSRGTGLGLAICRNIIERCKGEISYSKSFSLGGACFTIRYPKS